MRIWQSVRVAAIAASAVVLMAAVAPRAVAPPAVDAGRPGPTPTSFTMDPSSATFDVRHLPPLPDKAQGDKEREDPRVVVSPSGDLAAVGSGLGGASAPAPPPSSSFEGLAFNDDCAGTRCGQGHPPDTNGDVGPTYYIETVNTAVGIFNKSTGARVAAFSFNALMSQGTFGNLCDTDNFGDPVVVYDTFADRWIITDFAFQLDSGNNVVNPPGSYQCFAVSRTGDPVSGGWYFYSIHLTDGLQDYPKFGIWPDGLYMSANVFDFSASGSFQNVRVWALNRSQMEAGQLAQVVEFNAAAKTGPCGIFTLLPSNARLQTGIPPVGRPNLFASTWCYTNRVRIWQFHVDWSNTASSTFTGPTDSTAPTTWAVPPNAVPEKDGNDLDTLAMRLMVQNQYSNLNGVESLWDAHTVAGSSSSQAAIRFYQVPVTGGTIGAPIQAATYNPDTKNRWLPSVAVDRAGDMAIGYSVSDASMHPSIRYAGRLHGDAANTITQTETSLIDGAGAQVGSCGGTACGRWGDYSAMTLDPDGCTFWYTNEYYADLSLNDHTRIGSFSFPSCSSSPPPPTPTPVPTPTPSPTATPTASPTPAPTATPSFSLSASGAQSVRQGDSATYTIAISRTNFAGPIDFSISAGLPAGATATFAPDPSSTTSTLLTVTTSACSTFTPLGVSSLTITGTASGLTPRTTTAGLTVTDGPPKMTAPISRAYAFTTLGSTTVPIRTGWSACDPNGVVSYQVQRQVSGGAWSNVSASTTSTFTAQSLAKNVAYRYRVRATDGHGLTSGYAYTITFEPLLSDQTSTAAVYSGGWSTATASAYYGGSSRFATTAGASMSYTFSGSSIGWVAYRSSTRGSADVYVDGVFKATVNLNSSTSSSRVVVFGVGWSASGHHTITIVCLGTAGHPRVDVDAFVKLFPL